MSKITKKSLAILIIAVLLSSLMPSLISKAAEPVLAINGNANSEKSVNVGDIVEAKITINGLPSNIKQFSLGLEFDPNCVEPVYEADQVEDGEVYYDNVSDLIVGGINNANYKLGGNAIAVAVGSIGTTKLNTSGTVATFKFKLLKNPGVSGTNIKVSKIMYSEGKADSEEIEITNPNCSITIKGIVPMTDLDVTYTSANLYVGETVQMNVSKLPVDTTDTSIISYSSDNTTVATVDANGLVTAKSNGYARITAKCTSQDGTVYTKECGVLIVTTPLTSVTLNKTSVTLHKSAELQLVPTTNENVSGHVEYTWTSSNESVATVDNTGKVKALGVGKTTITVTATDGTKTVTNTCEITVDSPLTGLELTSSENVYLEIGATETANMSVVPVPGDTTDDTTITYKSSDETVAKVDSNGTIAAVGEGTATVTATCGNFSVSCNVTVTVHINSVEITSEDFELYVDQDPVQLNVKYDPEVFTDQGAVEWSVSDNTVIKVENGKVTALKPGTATVKATLKSNTSIYDEVVVTVPEVKAAGVVINTSKVTIEKYADEATKLNVKLVEPEDHPTTDKIENMDITWTSSDETVVKVEKGNNGEAVLVPVSSGTANITVKVGEYDEVSCEVTVICSLEEIKVQTANGASTKLVIKDEKNPATVQLETVKTPADADAKVEDVVYTSSNETVATVDENGVVTAVKPGQTVITATLEEKTSTIEISVEALLTDVEIENEKEDLIVYKGKTAELKTITTPSYATIIPTAVWTSSNEAVATVDQNGVVKAIKAGTAKVTVTYTHEDGTVVTASRDVVVKEVKATGVTITKKPESILKNEESVLEIEISKDNDKEELTDEIYWSSSDDATAYVSYVDGVYKVVGVKEGTATITVKVGDYSDTFEIAVKEIHIESIKAEIGSETVTEGEQSQIKVTINPTNSTDSKNFKYTVDNESVAKVVVDKNGVAYVKGINSGKAIVTITAENGVKTSFEVSVVAKPAVSGENGNAGGGAPAAAVQQAVGSLVGSPHTGDMNIVALAIMAVVSLAGMVITIKKK